MTPGVTRAGAAVRAQNASAEDIAVIDTWRAAHRPVLNTFNVMLRRRAKAWPDTKVGVRHKRRRTIFNKLERYPVRPHTTDPGPTASRRPIQPKSRRRRYPSPRLRADGVRLFVLLVAGSK